MAYFQYSGFNDGGSSVQIHYSVSYDSINNQTTVTFQPSWFRVFGNSETETIWDTSITVNEFGSDDTQESYIYFTQGVYNGRQFFDPIPTPSQIIVQHSSAAGKKSVQISSVTQKKAGIYSGKGSGSVTVESGEYIYGKVHEPTNCSLTYESAEPNSNKIYRDTVLNLSWIAAVDGDHNPVSGYRLYYGPSGEGYTQSLDIGNIQNYSFKIMDLFGGPRKGTTFTLGIQALATYGELHSSISTFGSMSIVNKPPEPPTFSTSGIIQITTGKNTPITVVNLQGKDIDDDPITYYYAISNSTSASSLSESILPENRIINMDSSKSHLFIRAKETNGSGVSAWTHVAATVNTTPQFEILYSVANINQAAARENSFIKYANILSDVKCEISSNTAKPQKFVWQIGTEDGYEAAQTTQGQTGHILGSYKVNPIASGSGGGKNIKIKVTITDEAGDSFDIEKITDFYRLYQVIPSSLEIAPIEKPTASVASRFINNTVKALVNNSLPTNDVQRTAKFYRGQKNENNQWVYTLLAESFNVNNSGKQTYSPIDGKIQHDIEYRFKVSLLDPFGNETHCESGSYYKLGLFNITQSSFSFNKPEWHPLKDYVDYKNTTSGDPFVVFTAQFSDNIKEVGKNSYTIEASYEGKTYELVSRLENGDTLKGWKTAVSGATITLSYQNILLFKKLKRATNTPQISVTYRITGYNAFGEPGATVSYNGTIITQERPINANMSFSAEINSDTASSYETWFNPGDQVTFTIKDNPVEYNDLLIQADGQEKQVKTITNYIIYYKYAGDSSWRAPEMSWEGWRGSFINNGQYLNQIIINSMPSLSLNKNQTNVSFGLQLIDDSGLTASSSELGEFLSVNLVACRKEGIVFSIDSASLDDAKLTVNLQTNDFGGNSLGFENFQRNGNEKFTITLYVSSDDQTYEEYTQTKTPYDSGSSATSVLNKYLNQEMAPFVTLQASQLNKGKLYIKAKLDIVTNYATNSKISATTAAYLLYLSQPTMSHRSHWVGINTSNKQEDEVFKVSEYETKKFIKLIGNYQGTDSNGNLISPVPIEIAINLKEGTMTSTIDNKNGYEINMRTGQIIVGDISANDIIVSDITASTLTGATISGGTW